MATPKNEFHYVSRLNAEALGKPGFRTFRILAESGSRQAVMWLEKQQLFQLAIALRQIILTSEKTEEARNQPPPTRDDLSLENLEFKVGKLLLGEDTRTGQLVIEAHDIESSEQESSQAVLRFWMTRSQAESLSQEALEVCAAGRPLCALCGGPINPEGHVCPRTNGHYKDLKDLS